MAHPLYIRSLALQGLDTWLQQRSSVPVSKLLAAAQLTPGDLDPDRVLRLSQFGHALSALGQSLQTPAIGLELLRTPLQLPALPLGQIVLAGGLQRQTLRAWVNAVSQMLIAHTNAFTIELIEPTANNPMALRLISRSPAPLPIALVEAGLAQLWRFVSDTAHRPVRLAEVRFKHAPPLMLDAHFAVFDIPPVFEAPFDELLIDADPGVDVVEADPEMVRQLLGTAMRQRARYNAARDGSVSSAVASAITTVIGSGQIDVETVAGALSLHAKQMQRLLADEGTTFSALLERERRSLAQRLLSETDLSIEAIAVWLDYSATAPFTTAFKRWTNASPLAYRRSARARR